MDRRHGQTGRDQALPHEAPESNPSQKNKAEGRKSETEKTDSQSATDKRTEDHRSVGGDSSSSEGEKRNREINRRQTTCVNSKDRLTEMVLEGRDPGSTV